MLRRILITLSLLATLSLSGCNWLRAHQMDVQQGNILPPTAAHQLKTGMSKDQVISLLGVPVLAQTSSNQLVYVYTWEADHKPMQLQKLVIYFNNGRLSHYTTNIENAPQAGA